MDVPYKVCETTEGAARLFVPDVLRRKGPGTAGPWPFYNPTMAVNRDMSAIVMERWPAPLRSVLDGLAATGAWGIRMSMEARAPGLTFNDRSSAATDLARENARRNGVDAVVTTRDLRTLLRSHSHDFVDIDPFGPPTPFLEGAFASARSGAGLGISATDTAVLCGTYPDACTRRYGARSLRCAQGGEIGLRILLGYCARVAAEHGHSIDPILSFAAAHFLRVFIRVRSTERAQPIQRVDRHRPGEFRIARASDRGAIGPLWLGPLCDPELVSALRPSSWTRADTVRLLFTIQGEAELPAFFVTTDELAAQEHGSPPKIDSLLGALRSIGYRAARTHFHPRGVRTDAPYSDVVRVFRERMPSESMGDSRPAS